MFVLGEDPLLVSQLGASVIRGIQSVTLHAAAAQRAAGGPTTAHGDESPTHDGVSAGWRFDFNGSAYVRMVVYA